jgi:uncharacterized BrkB/YihY/UPF0761 family membrane protein
MMTAGLFCSTPGLPGQMCFVNPNHVYFAWAIVVIALFLAVLPFLWGYRTGPKMPYRVENHFRLFVLFAIPLMLVLGGSCSFGGSLALLVSLPAVILIALLPATLNWLTGSSLADWFALPAAIIGLALYTWILVLIDRPLVKQIKTIKERNASNEQRECE